MPDEDSEQQVLPGFLQTLFGDVPSSGLGAALLSGVPSANDAPGRSPQALRDMLLAMQKFVFIVANNYVIAPYAQAVFDRSVSLPTPPDLWALIKIGLGGYVMGRSAEKCVTAWKN